MDGTLLDTMTSVPYAYVATIGELGGPDLTLAQLIASWHLGPAPVVLTHFLGRTVTGSDLECFYDHVAVAAESTRPFPGVLELLQALRHSGRTLAVYTSATRRVADMMLTYTGLNHYFPVVVTGDEVANPKPAPDGLVDACRLLGVPASATAYVGDADTDLSCALAAGAIPIHARWSAHVQSAPGRPDVAYHPTDVITVLTWECQVNG
nr:HAD family hydrolase [Planosporangium mesophilum]